MVAMAPALHADAAADVQMMLLLWLQARRWMRGCWQRSSSLWKEQEEEEEEQGPWQAGLAVPCSHGADGADGAAAAVAALAILPPRFPCCCAWQMHWAR